MKRLFIEAFGWAGIVAIFSGYLLISFTDLTAKSVLYQGLNLFGSLGIVVSSWPKRAYQPAVLNIVWAAVALAALVLIAV